METAQRPWESHPSVEASLQDFETPYEEPTRFDFTPDRLASDSPSHTAYRSPTAPTDMASDAGESDSTGPWSPPAWRRNPPSGWFQPHDRLMHSSPQHSPARSRQSSPEQQRMGSPDKDGDHTLCPEAVPLPMSPVKGRSPSPSPEPQAVKEQSRHKDEQSGNYIRFAVRAEVQHRTEPLEALIVYMRQLWRYVMANISSAILGALLLSVALRMIKPVEDGPGPDLVKIAGLARSFEPLIHYSEHAGKQIHVLQETGNAVWDLGESVRYSNLANATSIAGELDGLSENLNTLSMELTRFFAHVDGDVDSILLVMDWAKRELSHISSQEPTGSVESAYENMYNFLHKFGGPITTDVIVSVFGPAHSQRTKKTLQRTFNEFLNVMEEAILTELHQSTALFALFESIDRQFINVQRLTIRESDSQAQERDAELASLWRRMTGANYMKLAKFERNKRLLLDVRERTVSNKLTLIEHNHKLLQLKSNLEILRKRLVSPLLRSNDSTLTIDEQIGGLDGTYQVLRAAREKQKGQLSERFAAINQRREVAALGFGDVREIGDMREIGEGR